MNVATFDPCFQLMTRCFQPMGHRCRVLAPHCTPVSPDRWLPQRPRRPTALSAEARKPRLSLGKLQPGAVVCFGPPVQSESRRKLQFWGVPYFGTLPCGCLLCRACRFGSRPGESALFRSFACRLGRCGCVLVGGFVLHFNATKQGTLHKRESVRF